MLIRNHDDLKKAVESKLIVAANTEDCQIIMISQEVVFDSNFFTELTTIKQG